MTTYNFDVTKDAADNKYTVIRNNKNTEAVAVAQEAVAAAVVAQEEVAKDLPTGPGAPTMPTFDEFKNKEENQELEDKDVENVLQKAQDLTENRVNNFNLDENNDASSGGRKKSYKKHNVLHHKGKQPVISNKYNAFAAFAEKYSHALKTKKRKGKGKGNKKTSKNNKKITRK